jgi:hypothetical protein
MYQVRKTVAIAPGYTPALKWLTVGRLDDKLGVDLKRHLREDTMQSPNEKLADYQGNGNGLWQGVFERDPPERWTEEDRAALVQPRAQ